MEKVGRGKEWGDLPLGTGAPEERRETEGQSGGGAAKPACLPLLRSSRKEWEWMELVSERDLLGLYTEPYLQLQ